MNPFLLVVIIVLYLAVVGYLGYRGFRTTKSSADYLLGGRTIHPYVMAMSYGATFISTSAIVGFGGIAGVFGMSLLWLTFANIAIGILFAFAFLGKRTRRMGLNLDAHSFPELLGRRTESRFLQLFAGLLIFILMPLYASAVLIGASRIIENFLGIPYVYSVVIFSVLVSAYVIMGGLKGVMYTDALQGTLMFVGMVALLGFIYVRLGGITAAHASLTALEAYVPDSMAARGIQGWTRSPIGGSPLWWTVYSSIVLGVGIGVLAQPQLVVRFMTVRSNRELNRGVLIGGVFILVTVGTAYVVGALSNVYFFEEHGGQIAVQAAGGNLDNVIPVFINAAMPGWFVYLFMVVILSAAMSTLSSQFHAIGTSIGRDVYEGGIRGGGPRAGGPQGGDPRHGASTVGGSGGDNLHPESGRFGSVLATRIGIVISLLATVFLALNLGPGVIARATAIFFGAMASCFLAPYLAAVYWRGLSRAGAVSGAVAGAVVTLFCFLFLHESEAAVFGVSQALFGRTTLLGDPWRFIDPLVFGLPMSAIFTVVVSLATKDIKDETVRLSFRGLPGKG